MENKETSILRKLQGPVVASLVVALLAWTAASHQTGGGVSPSFQPGSSDSQTGDAGSAGKESAVSGFLSTGADPDGEQDQGAVFLVRAGTADLFALGLSSGKIEARIDLGQAPRGVVPTPGGVSVFVFYQQGGVIEVYSAETFEFQNRIETGLSQIRALSFSPNGDRVYLISPGGQEDSEVLTEYKHRLLELTEPRSAEVPAGIGALRANRRGTRLYRAGSDGVQIIFSQNLEVIETLETSLDVVAFDEGYSELWGIDGEGQVRVLDERSGRLVESFRVHGVASGPVVTDVVSILSAEGGRLLQFAPRSREVVAEIELTNPGVALTVGPNNTVLVFSQDGEVIQVAMGRIISRWSLTGTGFTKADFAGVTGAVASVVKRDGSFACF